MKIKVLRFADNGDATLGVLYLDGIFQCFTVEDEERAEKKSGETRVPEGIYDVKLRKEGGFHTRYTARYGDMHKGMLCIHNAPDWKLKTDNMEFQYILIHTGNNEGHTVGCLLVNDSVSGATFSGGSSRDAYVDVYPKIVKALESCEVTIEYVDIETGK